MTNNNLTWALVVPTLNRVDILEKCIECVLAQTCPPVEIIIVDASENVIENRSRILAKILEASIQMHYLAAEARSSAVQRNQGIRAAQADIVFLIDDDTLMHFDCAERIMEAYALDKEGVFLALGGVSVSQSPLEIGAEDLFPRKRSGKRIVSSVFSSAVVRMLWREVFMMSLKHGIIDYDPPSRRFSPTEKSPPIPRGIEITQGIAGFQLTARRTAALKEPFEPALLAYCPAEDVDFTYRLGRHGMCGIVEAARLYHHEAAAGRMKRYSVMALRIMNAAFFYRRHGIVNGMTYARFVVWISRIVFAELLKDTLSRRWSFPQFRGALAGGLHVKAILGYADNEHLGEWYRKLQSIYLR